MSDAPSAPTPTQATPRQPGGNPKTPVPAGYRAPARPGQARWVWLEEQSDLFWMVMAGAAAAP